MFLGKDGDRTIFQIMTRHGVDIGAFSVRSPSDSCWTSRFSCRERTARIRSDEERAWQRWLRALLVAGEVQVCSAKSVPFVWAVM